MKRTIVIFTLMSLAVIMMFGANQVLLYAKPPVAAKETMDTANQLYESGQFARAAQGYEQLLDQGFTDSILFYNLGNAYFKQGNYGRAILNYRQAERLAPRDADIQANLSLARTQIGDQAAETPVDSPSEGLVSRLGHWTQRRLTLNELAMLALVLWFLVVALVILFNSLKKRTLFREGVQYSLMVTVLVFTLALAGLGSRLYVEYTQPEGVIVAAEINVTSGPGAQYTTEFTLPGGTEVNLVEQRGNWVRLALPNQTEAQGWAPANAVAAIGR
jgi:tetratricopeptide (TPR) repeat protein